MRGTRTGGSFAGDATLSPGTTSVAAMLVAIDRRFSGLPNINLASRKELNASPAVTPCLALKPSCYL